MKNTKSKALDILKMIRGYRGAKSSVVDLYISIVSNEDSEVTISYNDKFISILSGDFNYLHIYPDNTVRCNEDGWGLTMQVESDIFIMAMNL